MFTVTNSVPPQECSATHFHRIILLSSIEELFICFCHCDGFKNGHQYIDTSSIERWSSVLPRGSGQSSDRFGQKPRPHREATCCVLIHTVAACPNLQLTIARCQSCE